MVKKKYTLPTKVEMVHWLKAQLKSGNRMQSAPMDFDLLQLVENAHFDVDRQEHHAYRLCIDEMKGYWSWEYEEPPELYYCELVNEVEFVLETNCRDVFSPEVRWQLNYELVDGEGASRFKDIDATLADLVGKYLQPELPNADNCDAPCEGADYSLLANALSAIEQEGGTLYTNGEIIRVLFPGETAEEDFHEYYHETDSMDGAGILDSSLEYELDWSKSISEESKK